MVASRLQRRELLAAAGICGAGVAGAARGETAGQMAVPVRWSTGTERPKTVAPPFATDCHFHVYDRSFPVAPTATLHPPEAKLDDYRMLQARLGTSRAVLVQPSTYGTFNAPYVALVKSLPKDSVRLVAVVDTSVTDADLRSLHEAGARGIRFNLIQGGVTTIEMVEPLARRVGALGWHCQMHMRGADIVAAKDLFLRLRTTVVFDHLGHVPEPAGIDSDVFALLRQLLDRGNAWVKLSGAYMDTKLGPPSYADSGVVVRALAAAAPERVVWGSDWPHPTEAADRKPDDALLFDLLAEWVPDPARRDRILVGNPAALYDFPPG